MADSTQDDLTLIGIGSSAGGLEAIRELVATLPTQLAVAYVVVQHMSPHHKSLMTQLVGRQTDLIVQDITDGTRPAANVVYMTPPKTDVILQDGVLRLKPPSDLPSAPKPSVDRFLLSLAQDHGANTMAIILSGTGTDGAYGVQAIREAGGITIAQDTDSAKYDGMPQAAIQTGCIDLVLKPAEIGKHLNKILTSAHDFSDFRQGSTTGTPVADLLQILLARTRVDFRDYKQTTITRRIERRMTALGITDQEEYTHFLRNTPSAVDALFKDLLISVTRFFRDPEEFEHLKELLPDLLKIDRPGPIRIWIAGCATGEEAYSIAMLICEAMGGHLTHFREKVQIFATDIDTNALNIARKGIYGTAALADIPSELAAKYLVVHGDGIRVTERLRSAILFSEHNVCQDPPFQKVQLLCCRNLLIYFGNTLQKKVMARFHYSMASDSLLFLGTAETTGGADDLFVADRKGSHIFRRRSLGQPGRSHYTMPNVATFTPRAPTLRDETRAMSPDKPLFDALLKSLGDNSIVVTEDGSIVQVNGSISPFIEVNHTTKLRMHLDLLKSPLREEARSLIAIALRNGQSRLGSLHPAEDPIGQNLQISVYPIIADAINERIALVVFTERPADPEPIPLDLSARTLTPDVAQRIKDLEHEVAVTREALQQTIEQLETSNEELQSLNEELQSTNEELQATNEELETSNEELQSTNEELITVNEELQITASELSGRTGELTSVLQSTPLAILVTDSALQITQATMAAADLFELKQPIATPHISQAKLPHGYPALAPICSETLRLGATTEHEFSSDGTRVMLSCTPYFDVNGKILGLTMVVTQFPGLAKEMELVLEESHIHLISRRHDGRILRISESSAQILGLTRAEADGRNLFDLVSPAVAQNFRAHDARLLDGESKTAVETIKFAPKTGDLAAYLAIEHHGFTDPVSHDHTIYSVGSDITDVIRASDRTAATLERFRYLQQLAGFGYWELDPLNKEVFWSSKVFEIHGMTDMSRMPSYDEALAFYHPDDVEMIAQKVRSITHPNGEFEFTARLQRADGAIVRVRSSAIAVADGSGQTGKIVGTFSHLED